MATLLKWRHLIDGGVNKIRSSLSFSDQISWAEQLSDNKLNVFVVNVSMSIREKFLCLICLKLAECDQVPETTGLQA